MIKVIKRDGGIVDFDRIKIKTAIEKAIKDVTDKGNEVDSKLSEIISFNVENKLSSRTDNIGIEDIQDIVLKELIGMDKKVHLSYKKYRTKRNNARNKKKYEDFKSIVNIESNDITKDNANMNADSPAGMMMKFASETTKQFVDDKLLSDDVKDAIEDNYIWVHDKDYYPTKSLTCLQHPLDKILENGFRAGHGASRPSKRIETASTIACISMETIQNEMHGGQAIPAFDFYLAPYVRLTFQEELKSLEKLTGEDLSKYYDCEIKDYVKKDIEQLEGVERLTQFAINKTVDRVHQSMEGFIHNMNVIHSRGGNQVVFSSINYGTDTSAEGRCIIRELLLSTDRGVGNGETPIFPIQIWKKKRGVNVDTTDPNYDLFELACKVTARRFFPNFLNLDATFNQSDKWKADDTKRYLHEVSTMGCVDGQEVITYKYKNSLYVESFKRMWDRLSTHFTTQGTKGSEYFNVDNVEIYDTENGFVKVKKVIRNIQSKWCDIGFTNGRRLLCTDDHPLPIIEKGRTFAKNLVLGDTIRINQQQYSEETIIFNTDKAWELGFILCDGSTRNLTDNSICVDEETIRNIPNDVFSWSKKAKLSFLAGMIDADGDINKDSHGVSVAQIDSTNKELTIQQMCLAQSLGMSAKIYNNHYDSQKPSDIRYRVEFYIKEELLEYIRYKKNSDNFCTQTNVTTDTTSKVKSIDFVDIEQYSYDVETESDYFEVSGIYSHNCRTRVFEDIFGDSTSVGRGNLSFTSINLVKIALESNKDIDQFFKTLGKYCDLVASQLKERYEFQATALKKQFPLLMSGMWNGSEQLSQDDTIREIIKTGTLGVGFIGLAECLIALTGYHHGESDEAQQLGLKIVTFMKEKTDEYKKKYQLNYSVLGTPAEGLSGKFTKKDRVKFGEIKNITDKEYYTNSSHIPVWYKCSINHKAKIEAPYHDLERAGHIFYVELDGDLTSNIEAVKTVVGYMDLYNIGYASLNHTRVRCISCGYESSDTSVTSCPRCKSEQLDTIQRITGYLVGSTSSWNSAKKAELKDRVIHK